MTLDGAIRALRSWAPDASGLAGADGRAAYDEALDVVVEAVYRDAHQRGPTPTLYGTLAAKRTEVPGEAVAAALSAAFATVQAQMRTAVGQALGALYAEGVRDGFVQGVAAECARRDENGGGDG